MFSDLGPPPIVEAIPTLRVDRASTWPRSRDGRMRWPDCCGFYQRLLRPLESHILRFAQPALPDVVPEDALVAGGVGNRRDGVAQQAGGALLRVVTRPAGVAAGDEVHPHP